MADVTMPQLGETVTEGTVTRWLKQVGDTVALDEPLVEISTDKVDTELPSPVAGVLQSISANEGDVVQVGELLAVVGDGAARRPAAPAAAGRRSRRPLNPRLRRPPRPAPAPELRRAEPPPAPAAATRCGSVRCSSGADDNRLLSPVVRRLVQENGLDPSTIEARCRRSHHP
jgi:2-oxoglutarate dehydrogenase E2 component (dihydrolipoamide succinyltransferase)